MSLKLRYAAFLLFLFFLLLGFCAVTLHLITQGNYVLTAMLFFALYGCTYLLGKRFSRIFFVLSFLRALRKNGGSLTQHELDLFLEKYLAGRRSPAEVLALKDDILNTLLVEKAIVIAEDTIVLLDH
jgi:hypothetical protein